MPHHTGVLTASILLIIGLGINMAAFPEVWKMLRNDSSPNTAMPDHMGTQLPTEEAKKEPKEIAKPVSVDKPIPIDPPKPVAPAPKTAAETPPKPVAPTPKSAEPTPKQSEKLDKNSLTAAFAPIVPSQLLELEQRESLLPTVESASTSGKGPTPSVAAPAYAEEFKPIAESSSRPTPKFETLDSALARPIVYESHPTVKQRVTELSTPLSPIGGGPIRRLPTTD